MTKRPKKQNLTPKQAMFAKEYIVDYNSARAARAAKYSKKSASVIGVENLTKPVIQQAIQKEVEKRALRTERTADDVLNMLWSMAEYSLEDYFDISDAGEIKAKRFDQLKPGAAKIINGIKFKKHKRDGEEFLDISDLEYKMPDKVKVVELLMKHHGLFEKDAEQGATKIIIMPTNVVKPANAGTGKD